MLDDTEMMCILCRGPLTELGFCIVCDADPDTAIESTPTVSPRGLVGLVGFEGGRHPWRKDNGYRHPNLRH